MTMELLKQELNTAGYGWFRYRGKDYFIDYFAPNDMYIGIGEKTVDFASMDEMMQAPVFDGRSLEEIAEDLEPI